MDEKEQVKADVAAAEGCPTNKPTEKPPKPSFKSRVRKVAVEYAHDFEDYFVNHEYLLCSEAFENSKFYTVKTNGTQYRHLIGVGPSMDAQTFYDKCKDGTLTEDDISFVKHGQSETVVKGYVRRKIKCIPQLIGIFSNEAQVEEDFQKNTVRCSFATGTKSCTVGFTLSSPARPMTLLSGDLLASEKSKPLALVLRKGADDEKYSEIYVGNVSQLKKYGSAFKELLSDDLLQLIEPETSKNDIDGLKNEENIDTKKANAEGLKTEEQEEAE